MPLDVEDTAAFYYNEKLYTEDRIGRCSREAVLTKNVDGTLILLGPGAKGMLVVLWYFLSLEQECCYDCIYLN